MIIRSFIWLTEVIEKIESKHEVTVEVEEIFKPGTIYRRGPRGKKRKGEDIYKAYGQTDAGRFVCSIY